jgi:hypothetical protein
MSKLAPLRAWRGAFFVAIVRPVLMIWAKVSPAECHRDRAQIQDRTTCSVPSGVAVTGRRGTQNLSNRKTIAPGRGW